MKPSSSGTLLGMLAGVLATSSLFCPAEIDPSRLEPKPFPSLADPSFSPVPEVHWEAADLGRKDATKLNLIAVSNPEIDSPTQTEHRPDVLILERLVVTQRPPDKIEMPRPIPKLRDFFDSGNIAVHVGRKITTRFWLHPHKGLMLSFEF